MALTEDFEMIYGVEYNGILHTKGTLRLPTMGDVEAAIEEAPETSSPARINRHIWARTIVRLGDIPRDSITPALLETAIDGDYGELQRAEERLRKKWIGAKSPLTAPNSDESSLPLSD